MKKEEEISWRLTIVKVFIHYDRASLVQSVIKGKKKTNTDILNVQNFTQPDFGLKKIDAKKSVIFFKI